MTCHNVSHGPRANMYCPSKSGSAADACENIPAKNLCQAQSGDVPKCFKMFQKCMVAVPKDSCQD